MFPYLCELVQHAGQLAGVRALSVVLLGPASGAVAAPPRFLRLLAGGVMAAAGRAGGGAGQEGKDAG